MPEESFERRILVTPTGIAYVFIEDLRYYYWDSLDAGSTYKSGSNERTTLSWDRTDDHIVRKGLALW